MASENSVSEADISRAATVQTGGAPLRCLSMMTAGLVAAGLSWKAMGLIGDVFVLPPKLAGLSFGQAPPPAVQAELAAATLQMNIKNAGLWMATTGGILGMVFGCGIGMLRGRSRSGLRVAIVTIVAGCLFGGIAGAAAIGAHVIARQNMAVGATSPSDQLVLLMHSLTWLIVSAGIGWGIWLGTRRPNRSRLDAVVVFGLAGLVGGCLFPIIAGIVFPAVNSTAPIPYLDPTAGRILWLSLPSALMGLAIGRNG